MEKNKPFTLLATVLAGVTYLYYREAKAHTKEMQKTREQNMRPVIKPTIYSYDEMIHPNISAE